MGYRVYNPSMFGGWMTFWGKTYEVHNHELVIDDLHAANYLVEHNGCRIVGTEAVKLAKKLLVKRGRGLGDILMMTPVLRKIKAENPACSITYACDELFLPVLKYLPYIDRIVTIPQLGYHQNQSWVTESDGSRTMQDHWVNCDGIAENFANHNDISTKHRVDIFGGVAGLSFTAEERRLDYMVSEEEAAWAQAKWKEFGLSKDDKVLAMAVRTTNFNRNMPGHKFRAIAEMASAAGWKTILFDHDGQFGWEAPNVVNMTGKTSIREMAALMARCTMFFGPDTGAWHLACALNVPNVVYFGAMDWRLRVTMPRTRVIVRNAPCYPCNRYDCHWHQKLVCIDLDPARCWADIELFERDLRNNTGTHAQPIVPGQVSAETKTYDAGYKPNELMNNLTGRPLSVH